MLQPVILDRSAISPGQSGPDIETDWLFPDLDRQVRLSMTNGHVFGMNYAIPNNGKELAGREQIRQLRQDRRRAMVC